MTPTDQQVEQLDTRTTRAEALIRQIQGMGGVPGPAGATGPQGIAGPTGPRGVPLRVVGALPALGTTGDMVLFAGNVWVDNGTAWKQLAYA